MGNGSFFASDFVSSSASYLCNRRNKSVDQIAIRQPLAEADGFEDAVLLLENVSYNTTATGIRGPGSQA